MKRIKPVYFHDQRGFLLTFGPEDDDLYRWVAPLTSDRIRQFFGLHSFAEIQEAAGDAGIRSWMRDRLRAAMPGEPGPERSAPTPVSSRAGGWPERDLAIAPRVERLFEAFAPEDPRVLDPFAGAGLYTMVAGQQAAETFWCEISPVQRFLAAVRSRALYREDTERERLADELFALAELLPDQIERAGAPGSSSSSEPLSQIVLRRIADEGHWTTSGIACDVFRAAVVSLLADGERLDQETIASELRRHARYIAAQKSLRTFPTLLADDAADLRGMRPTGANLLLTSPPFIGSRQPFFASAEEFLSIDTAAERRRAIPPTAEIPRGRGTTLHLEHSIRELSQLVSSLPDSAGSKRLIDELIAIVETIEEPGKAAMAARTFADLLRVAEAIEHHLASRCSAIIDGADSWFSGRLLQNAAIFSSILRVFGFEETEVESVPIRNLHTDGEPLRKEHRVIIMRRDGRASGPTPGWAVWA